jgi:hypothetical protein
MVATNRNLLTALHLQDQLAALAANRGHSS